MDTSHLHQLPEALWYWQFDGTAPSNRVSSLNFSSQQVITGMTFV
jgi:hypothetical protein